MVNGFRYYRALESAKDSSPHAVLRLPVNTVIHTTIVGLEPVTFRSLVRRATSSATEPREREREREKIYLPSQP